MLPAADAFMVLMVSRPASGSLRNTWVTPATLAMCVGVCVVGVPAELGLAFHRANLRYLFLGVLLFFLVVGSLSVALIGVVQRLVKPAPK